MIAEIVSQLNKMIELWSSGVRLLDSVVEQAANRETQGQCAVASAIEGHLRCTVHIIEFFRHRSAFETASADQRKTHLEAMKVHLFGHIATQSKFPCLIEREPAIGFHSEILEFSYDVNLIASAIRVNNATLDTLGEGIDTVLQEVIKRSPVIPPDTSVGVLDRDGD